MSKRIERIVERIAEPVVISLGLTYVDTDYRRAGDENELIIYIDKPEGVTFDDCQNVSRRVEKILDTEDSITEQYILCVSSPGLDRPIQKPKDFERSIGKEVDIKLYRKKNAQKALTGILKSFDENGYTVEIDGEDIAFSHRETAKLCLHVDF